jgi:hypothetical protein
LTQDGLKEVARDVANTFTTKVTGGADQAAEMSASKDPVAAASTSPSLVSNRTRPSDRGTR